MLPKSAMPTVEGLPTDLAPCVFVSECLHVSVGGTSFSLLFSKLSKLFLQGLGLWVSIRLAR